MRLPKHELRSPSLQQRARETQATCHQCSQFDTAMTDLPQTNQTATAVHPGELPQTRIIARPTVADWTIRLIWRDTFGALHELTGDLASYRRSGWGKLAPDGP